MIPPLQGQDQLLREARGRLPEERRHGRPDGEGPELQRGRGLLERPHHHHHQQTPLCSSRRRVIDAGVGYRCARPARHASQLLLGGTGARRAVLLWCLLAVATSVGVTDPLWRACPSLPTVQQQERDPSRARFYSWILIQHAGQSLAAACTARCRAAPRPDFSRSARMYAGPLCSSVANSMQLIMPTLRSPLYIYCKYVVLLTKPNIETLCISRAPLSNRCTLKCVHVDPPDCIE